MKKLYFLMQGFFRWRGLVLLPFWVRPLLQTTLLIFLLLPESMQGQIDLPVYIDGKSEEELKKPDPSCLSSNIAKFIAKNTDSEFVQAHMNPGDSIEFKIELVIGKDGFVIPSRTKVATQYDFFNQYMTEVLNKLPKFKPAQRKGYAFDYPYSAIPQFVITPDQTMLPLFDCEKYGKIFRPVVKAPPSFAEFPGCSPNGTNEERWKCTQNRIGEFVIQQIDLKHQQTNGMVIVRFVIDEQGFVSEWKILRDIGMSSGYAVIQAVRKLPRMKPAVNEEGKPIKFTFTLPIHMLY